MLTAHPTEIRRKSTMDREIEVAALLDQRERVANDAGGNAGERRTVAPRGVDLVADQPAAPDQADACSTRSPTACRFTKTRSFASCRGSIAVLEDRLATTTSAKRWGRLPSFLRMGSWIGGDRDGNPFVTADVMRGTLQMQSALILRYYLGELHRPRRRVVVGGKPDRRSAGTCAHSPSGRRTPRLSAAASRTGRRSPASMRGWRQRPGSSTSRPPSSGRTGAAL